MNQLILIVDDEPAARYGMVRALEKEGYRLLEADSVAQAEAALGSETPGVVLLDVKLGSESGLEYLPVVLARENPPAVIMVTAHGSEKMAVDAIRQGAYDYLAKPFEVDDLRIAVRNALESFTLRNENQNLRLSLSGTGAFGQLIGSSDAMARVYSVIDKVSETDANVLITGESGTGKEMVAREIHNRSRRRGKPFIAVNCAALPDELIESELFGHEKGAFTSAATRRIGKFEAASEGTIFLDEIGDMSLSTQAKVLRVLEDRSFQRLGSNETLSTNARIISATNKDLSTEVEEENFRADLFYRLCVVTIDLPPLRERKSDIAALAQTFCDRYGLSYRRMPLKLSRGAIDRLLGYSWPGNVRELRNAIERAVVLADKDEITLENLPQETRDKPNKQTVSMNDDLDDLLSKPFRDAKRDFERRYIQKSLEDAQGNISRAAQRLGMHRQSLQHKMKELGLTKQFVSRD